MSGACELVVIGASWGGLGAVGTVLEGLPADFGAPVVVVQHRQSESDDLLSRLLRARGPLAVVEADDKSPLEAGTVLVAPSSYHTLVERGHVILSVDAPLHFSRPSIDVAFESAAQAYGSGVVGVVLTGASADGAAGLATVRKRGAIAIVQNPATAERREMPAAAVAAANPQFVVEIDEIAPLLVRIAAGEVLPR